MYDTHITSNGTLCHDRTSSVPDHLKAQYQNGRYNMCLFGPYDAPRVEWVNRENLSNATDTDRLSATRK